VFAGRDRLWSVLDELREQHGELLIVEGGATGADSLAREWAVATKSHVEQFKADWTRYGRSAGPIRNQRMLTDGAPDLVVACEGGKGTADMVRRARAAGIRIVEVP